MKTKVDVNLSSLFGMLQNTQVAERAAAEELARICDPYVPFLSGDLSGSAKVHSSIGETYVEWNMPYANYVYQGVVMAGRKPKHVTGTALNYGKQFHPLAGPQWDKRALNDHPGVLEAVVMGVLSSGK